MNVLFCIVGAFCCGVGVLVGLVIVLTHIIGGIGECLYRKKYKNRFKKKPTAACYCKDCRQWIPETGCCTEPGNSKKMADNCFCCFAEPLTWREYDMMNKEDK